MDLFLYLRLFLRFFIFLKARTLHFGRGAQSLLELFLVCKVPAMLSMFGHRRRQKTCHFCLAHLLQLFLWRI